MEKRRTRAEQAVDSRRRLVLAAVRVLAERGYAGASLAAIGQEAGVSRGLVTHHFGSKEQCIAEVVATIREAVVERAATVELHGLAALDNLVRTYLGDDEEMAPAVRAMYVIIVHAATAGPDLMPAVAENNRALRALIERILADAVERGEVAEGEDLAALAVGVAGVMRGVLVQQMVDDRLDRAAATEAAVTLVRRALAPGR